ncbi:Uncharacterized protein OS=Singulisphaera acidiphila (strain ATCC BAA-1392 / DSM 18658 / VKM B-2454 / MOB10) GN=Sinac_0896 PE=4 SV=1 [Tuwongella immobilis]|uniref:Uncharacterized protein n=2 Tax=Tuwongella immobilis TaxID=692036 RepID=A0A6C2YM67_9BACT|nr:Uncharacterized protein OS=Singulisphaera acidiphila (strain ATCC BAA-1392 / DSM 18658 / VKM B-2454 / MOB10) GN=Sinac_0896 PE=4 SV=1 [Tuwongella immobilis]VTS01447.1 Uncharacterized protein OS=Singulisphaera acidiphila (strain ATCC BAA-1392 / DSM 18658 / VKM B-2454 / MOB10) GN=Sinac_0896 PE=4 SV=1 [Tuwongella immobilis]
MAVVPGSIKLERAGEGVYTLTLPKDSEGKEDLSKWPTKNRDYDITETTVTPRPRVSQRAWMGPAYLLILLLVIVITNIPLRGLWSLIVIITAAMLGLIIALMGWADDIVKNLSALHIYINMSGYLFVSAVLFVIWFVAVNIFDKRTYIAFTPGQIRVCEEIGGREKSYDTIGMTLEKHRDDLFRHWILGFGSGDLTVRTSGADRHEIVMQNVLGIGWRLPKIEAMLRAGQAKVSSS